MICECEKGKRGRWKKWPALVFVIAIMIMFLQIRNCGGTIAEDISPDETVCDGVGLVIDSDAKSRQPSGNNNTAEQDVAITGRRFMTVPANQKEVTVDFYNPEENAGLYYLMFELRLYDDSEQGYEVLYTSGLIEPGKRLDRITLPRGLEKGVYEAVVHVQPYRMNEERTPTNNANINTQLIVQ